MSPEHRGIGGLAPVDARQDGEGASIYFGEILYGAESGERGHLGHTEVGLLQVLMRPLDPDQPVFGVNRAAEGLLEPSLQLP
jgi:hypothetical protein